jgi:hypothetical protein
MGPILWDFAKHTIVFVRNGHLDDLLRRYQGIFATPMGLRPVRSHSHQIHLLPGTASVAVRPKCYAHLQKEELEKQSDRARRCSRRQCCS